MLGNTLLGYRLIGAICTLLLLSCVVFAQVGSPAVDEKNPSAKTAAQQLSAALKLLPLSEAKFIEQLCHAPPVIVVLLEQGLSKHSEYKDATKRSRLVHAFALKYMNKQLRKSLNQQADLRFHGQFDFLKSAGPVATTVLLELLLDEDLPVRLRVRAAGALGDLGGQELLKPLQKAMADFLVEAWFEREVGYLLARLGDRSYVDRWLAESAEIVQQKLTSSRLPDVLRALSQLSEISYRIEDYDSAILHYKKRIEILNDLQGNVRVEMQPAIHEEVLLLHYNLACSQSLLGKQTEAFASLEYAMLGKDVSVVMVEKDGDLRGLRADKRFLGWIAKQRTHKKELKKRRGASSVGQ